MRWICVLFMALPLWAQYDLRGVIDLHTHTDPDSIPRSLDAAELAAIAHQRGMRGLVLKNHWQPTASLAYMVRRQVPGIEVFGGIALNRAVGGVNAEAVERMVRTRGGYGRVVWLPTFDAESIPLMRGSELLPEVTQVLSIAAREGLVVGTGHYPPAVVLAVVRAARKAGVRSVVVTHAMSAPIEMGIEQQKEAAALGAFIEHAFVGTLPSPATPGQRSISYDDYARAIRSVGPAHCILVSDLGRQGHPIHPDGLLAFADALLKRGFAAAELDLMLKTNPARLLNLASSGKRP